MDKTQNRELQTEKLDAKKLLALLIPKSLFVLAGYLATLAALPFGAAPFGLALLAAADRNALFVWLGLSIAAFTSLEQVRALTLFGIATALLLLRALVRLTLNSPYRREDGKRTVGELLGIVFFEAPTYRVLASAVASFAVCVCLLAGGGFLYYDLFGLLISCALAPLSTLVFYGFFTKKQLLRDTAFLAISAVCVHGAANIKIYGVSLAAFIALCLTIFVTTKKGTLWGSVTGIVLGVVFSPILSPAFLFCALSIGIFMKISPTLSFFSALASSVAWGFYARGIYALDGFLAAAISACLLSSAVYKLFSSPKTSEQKAVDTCRVLPEGELDGIKLFDINRRINAMSEGFEKLSEFLEEARARFPSISELVCICEDAFESSCASCPNRSECREKVDTSAESERLAMLLSRDRGLNSHDIDDDLIKLCGRLPDILDEINYNAGVRMKGEGEPALPDYKSLSRLIEKSSCADGGEYTIDFTLSESLCAPLDSLGADITGVMVWGKRKRTVYIKAKDLDTLERKKQTIFDTLCDSLPFALDNESLCLRKCAGGAVLSVSEGERVELTLVTRQKKASKERRWCGDTTCAFKNADNRFFSLISDGMGSGREASAVSEICARFIEGMLSVGSVDDELLEMLNRFLCSRGEGSLYECSATLDLMELDLISGRATFFKGGAAPTYLLRGGNLFKLRSRSMPIGIIHKTDIGRSELELSDGDIVVMMSDGVTGGREECPWLFDLLRQNIESSGLERTADLILKYAVGHGSEDDISVVVARVSKT